MTRESSDFEAVYLTLGHVLELYGRIIGTTAKGRAIRCAAGMA